ncbi:MAG: L-serine ammonia-lyase, partial [Achromobacter sp.]
MAVSVFDLFKVGIGPSSSHTVGPMRAAVLFTRALQHHDQIAEVARVRVALYGSLGATGKGHGSGTAVMLGLAGHEPDTVDVDDVPNLLNAIRDGQSISLGGSHPVAFNDVDDIVFHRRQSLPFHANGMTFTAYRRDNTVLREATYYSVGGGFVVSDAVASDGSRQKIIAPDTTILPYPFHHADDLLRLTQAHGISIATLMRGNERHWRTDREIDAGLLNIWQVMQDCVRRGCRTEGILPGGFKVRRRAARLAQRLGAFSANPEDPLRVLDWVNLWALAVNEENAAGGRVVTAPTNGAAGIIPAVLH